ncbi:MAG TPA: DUF3501 family protein [Myxococcales bacterium]|nr:DUF3501 family protein [Myxococcales bacterium]
MKKLTRADIWPNAVYEKARDEFRARIVAEKAPRRVQLGDSVTLVFENRDTAKFQIQEMIRIEGITSPEGVQAEIDVYNELVPAEGELSATLMIDVTEEEKIKVMLNRLVGIEDSLWLCFGGREVKALFAQGQTDGARVSAVQYVHFALGSEERRVFAGAAEATLELRHPAYRATARLSAECLASLRRDLAS